MPPILLENPRRGLIGLILAILLCLVLWQSLLPTPARAQAPTGQPQQGQPSGAMSKEEQLLADLRERTLAAINHTMTAFNTGIGVFNTQIGIINEARPLDPANLDSATIAANVSRTLAFVSYLDGYVRANDSLARSLEDSVEVLRNETPTGDEEKALTGFQEAYKADHTAWNSYLSTLKDLYNEVLDVLLFLQRTEHSVKGTQLQFRSAEAGATYKKLMKPIDATVKRSAAAIEASKKATAWAEQKIAEINGAPAAAPKPSATTKKRKRS